MQTTLDPHAPLREMLAGAKARPVASRQRPPRRPFSMASRWIGSCALAVSALSSAPSALAAAPTPVHALQVADYRPYLEDDHPVRRALVRFSALTAAYSHGLLFIDLRKQPVPGSPAAQIDAVRRGDAGAPELMLFPATGLAGLEPEMGLFDLPYALRDARQVDAVLDGPLGRRLLERLEPGDLVGLSWWENGFRQVTTSKVPVLAAQDFHALQIRVLPEPVFVETFRALGSQPRALSFSRLVDSLKAGEVTAQEGFDSQVVTSRLYETQQHLSVTNHSYGAMALVMRASVWEALSAEERRWIHDAAVEAAREQRTWAREDVRLARDAMRRHGMQIHILDPATVNALAGATQGVRDRFLAGFDPEVQTLYRHMPGYQ